MLGSSPLGTSPLGLSGTIPLPTDIAGGTTVGHVDHHNEIHTEFGLIQAVQGNTGHEAQHIVLKNIHDNANPGNPLPDFTSWTMHDLAHTMLHDWFNNRGDFVLGETKPDASNTSYRITPTTVENGTNGVFVPTSGVTYENVEFRCIVRCNSRQNVTFRDCWFRGPAAGGITGDSALIECQSGTTSGIVVEYSLIDPQAPNQYVHGIRGRGYTLYCCDVKHVVDAFGVNQSGELDVVVEGNYMHDLSYFSPCSYQGDDRTHCDTGQVQGGNGVRIFGNTIHGNVSGTVGNGSDPAAPAPNPYYPSTTGQALAFTPQTALGPVTGVEIIKNWIDYGAKGITFAKGSPAGSNVGVIQDNRFGRNIALIGGLRRAIVIDPAHTYTASGNVYEDDSSPVQIYVTTSY